jgi:hypothetical protein
VCFGSFVWFSFIVWIVVVICNSVVYFYTCVLLYSIAVHGVEPSAPVPVIGPRMRPSYEDDFLRMYPAKSILELNSTQEDGAFVVFGVIDDLVEGQEWWYPACKCHRSVTPDSGAYYCKGCVKHVFHMVPRYDNVISYLGFVRSLSLECHLPAPI